jgi:hypothetical protein
MKEKILYTDDVNREEILNLKMREGRFLVEDTITLTDKFLIFSDSKPTSHDDIERRLVSVEDEIVNLKMESKSSG